MKLPDTTLRKVIQDYTREAGVRNLEREIATLLRKAARKIVSRVGEETPITIHPEDLKEYLAAISWKPFFFIASISVDIGVSYRLNLLFCHKTISLSLGASINMWGPPTGGKVRVHLWCVSFTVSFGSDNAGQQNDPLQWGGFKSLLPATNDVCKLTVSDGLYKTQDSTDSTSGKTWIVRATNFKFFTQSSIPASNLSFSGVPVTNTALKATGNGAGINVKPMNLKNVTSTHAVTISRTPPKSTANLLASSDAPATGPSWRG